MSCSVILALWKRQGNFTIERMAGAVKLALKQKPEIHRNVYYGYEYKFTIHISKKIIWYSLPFYGTLEFFMDVSSFSRSSPGCQASSWWSIGSHSGLNRKLFRRVQRNSPFVELFDYVPGNMKTLLCCSSSLPVTCLFVRRPTVNPAS